MTSLTLVAAAVCLFALPALGGIHPSSSVSQQYRSYPYPPNARRGFPYNPRPERYEYGPITALKQGQNGDQQGTDGQGSQGAKGQSQGANGQSQGGQGGMGGQGGRGDDRPNSPDAIASTANRRTTQFFFQPGPVIFDNVTTNIGGGYNSDYGVFTAFESGIYVVDYNVVSPKKGTKTAAVDLLRNNEVINSASGRGTSGETSNSAVLFLNRYDQLSVQGRAESAVFCGNGGNDAFCSFNVALVKMGVFSDSKTARPVPGW